MNSTHPAPSLTQPPGSLATYLQQMRDQERGDLARELHDELGSLLTGAKLEVASLKLRLDGASADIQARLKHLGETINSGITAASRSRAAWWRVCIPRRSRTWGCAPPSTSWRGSSERPPASP